MKCAIMQPTYLPWAGYFSLLSSVDTFVFLDDVQFSKGSWQQRNRILLNDQEHFLTVPILKKGKSKQKINEVEMDERKPWRRKHLQTLKQAYHKHPYGQELVSLLEECLSSKSNLLVDLNIEIIKRIARELDLHPSFYLSSELPVIGKRSEYVLNICDYIDADTYISPPGAKDYIDKEGYFENSEVEIKYHEFVCHPYPQIGNSAFVSHLSIIDMIANIGFEETKTRILEGHTT